MEEYIPYELKGKELLEVINLGSKFSKEESIELKFYVKTTGNLVKVAQDIARDETTGPWVGQGEPTQLFIRSQADVDRIERYGEKEGVIYIRTPLSNISSETDPLYQFIMLAVGGPVLEFVYYQEVALLDFSFPRNFLERFPGPKFGINGVRKLLNLKDGEPIIGTIVKPCAGLTPREVAEKCYQSALGGVMFIKDDEKMLGPDYCPLEEKVKLVSQALKRAEEETGRKCLYAPHIVARADKIKDVAKRAIEWGATALMFNAVLGHTYEALSILAEDKEIDVPLYAHSGGRSGLSTGPRRIDDTVIAKLLRYSGADFFQHGVFGMKEMHVASLDDGLLHNLVRVMREDVGVRDTIPVAAGGLGVTNAGINLKEHKDERFGYSVALLAGSNILKHPDGPKAGATAMHQAVQAYYEKGITEKEQLKEYALKRGWEELLKIL
ncbi:MAG TPA: RuBisCO large subunit C-terminal-like domain-containing protein [bacterium]|nr:RuBisCO large subunit C-terminal-like domain-containing protein [bacterium]